jgi:ABC-type cobalamin/Fe3+-siderophores transport system ATPase subunit
VLQLDRISFWYGGGTLAIDGVSLRFEPGELVALTGPNGSGKSTLLKCAARVLVPQSGSIRLDDEEARQWLPKAYARAVGYLPQNPEPVVPIRAIDVVVSGRAPWLGRFSWESARDYEEAERALRLCDAAHLAERYLDEMSGGERKRIFLARVLAGEPRLILLDEPLTALDVAHVQQLAALLRQVVERTTATVIFSSHELNWSAAYADRMLVMNRGRVVMDGHPREVMTPEVMRDAFGFDAEAVTTAGRTWIVPRV